MTRDFPFCILDTHSRSFTENGDDCVINKRDSCMPLSIAEEKVHLLTVLPVQELALLRGTFLLPGIDRLSHIVGNPDPERPPALPGRNLEVIHFRKLVLTITLARLRVLFSVDHLLNRHTILAPHLWVPLFSQAIEPQACYLIGTACGSYPDKSQSSVEGQRIGRVRRQIT